MKFGRTLCCAIALIHIVAGAVGAQSLPGRVSAGGIGQTQLSLTSADQGTFKINSDVIFGNGGTGPYTMSYKPVNRFSESVSIDGKLVQRDFDYDVNYAAGTITFKKGIASSSAIRVEYSFDPSKATPNRAPISIPVTLDLVKKQGAGLKFTGLYKQADPNVKTASDLVVYGLTGDKAIGQGGLSSLLLFSPDINPNSQSTFSERSAMQFGGSTKGDNFSLKTSFTRVGEQFTAAKEYKEYALQQGTEVLDLSASYQPGKMFNLSSSYNQTETLIGEKKGEVVTTMNQTVAITPNGAPKMTLTHNQVSKEKPNAAEVTTTTDKVLMEHKLSTSMSATATHETVTTDTGGAENRVSTNQLVLNAKAAENVGVVSRITQKDSSTDGGLFGYGMDINATPNKTTTVKASMNRQDAEKTGQSGMESLNLTMNPSKLFDLRMNVVHANTDASGDAFTHAVTVTSAPKNWVLQANLNGKNVASPADEFAQVFMLKNTSIKNTTVQFNWVENESDAKGGEQIQGVKVVTTPIEKRLTLTGGLSQRETASARDISKEATISVQPFTDTTLTGAYTETESNGVVVAKVQQVTADTKPADFLKLTGDYKTREYVGQEDLDSLKVAMTVNSGRLLSVTGTYNTNPEDQKGVVQRVNTQTVGVKTDFGKLKVRGDYTMRDEYLAGKRGEQKGVGLDYRLSAHSLLTTNYNLTETEDTSLMETHVYSLGYTHRVGSSLNVYLTGKMTAYEKDRTMLEDQTEYEAEARVGLKF